MILDTWPACACAGRNPLMLEHSPQFCAKLPHIVLDAIAADRPLTEVELAQVAAARDRAVARGADAGGIAALMDVIVSETPQWPSPYAPPAPEVTPNGHIVRPVT